jgi:hypothetical protein
MSAPTAAVAITGVLTAGIIYGTDAFCAFVQRPALAALDDATLTAVVGRVHEYADRRLPAPGIIGILAAAVTTTVAAIRGPVPGAIAAGVALVSMLAWLRLYLHIAAPINRAFTAGRGARDARQRPGPPVEVGQHHHPTSVAHGAAVAGLGISAASR